MPDFNPELHRSLIQRRGEPIVWRRSHQCACMNPVTRQQNPRCEVCDGIGYLYIETGEDLIALVRQVDERQQLMKYGQAMVGDITVTTMPDTARIGAGDMIELTLRTFRYEENIAASGETTDVLHYTRVGALEYVASLETTYVVDTDCVLNPAGTGIIWLTTPPDAGVTLSIAYLRIPQYIVQPGAVATRRVIGGVQMPQRIAAKLLNREDFR